MGFSQLGLITHILLDNINQAIMVFLMERHPM
jgi:hypothetical protein